MSAQTEQTTLRGRYTLERFYNHHQKDPECCPDDDHADRIPDHITPCECPNHDGICDVCGFRITIGTSGTEYGHAAINNSVGECPHRPRNVNTHKTGGRR